MKKKLLFLLFLLGFFFYMPNAYAEYFSVCDSCDYQTLDQALTAAENSSNTDAVFIYLYTSGPFTVSNHNLNRFIEIFSANNDNVVISGGGSTINSMGIRFNGASYYYYGYLNNLSLSDITFRSDNLDSNFLLSIGYFNQAEMSNVVVKTTSSCDASYCEGIELYSQGTSTLDSVTVDGFMFGVRGGATIKNSDLAGNLFSLYSEGNTIKLENTKLSYIYGANGNFKFDLDDVKKIIVEDISDIHTDLQWIDYISRLGSLYDSGDYEDNLRIVSYGGLYGTVKKNATIESPNSTINLLDAFFGDDSFSLSDFDIDVSNDEVMVVENGVAKPLKNGKCTISLINKDTDMEYRLTVNVSGFETTPKVNPKTKNTILAILLVLLLMVTSLGSLFMKKRHN